MQSLDLRLLSVFDEIYKTRSVTRAADHLAIGQPAVSIALARLRRHFGDALFVRTSSGMEPTPLGEELVRPVRTAIEALGAALGHRSTFDPGTAERTFRICMTDISMALLPALWARMHESAPGVKIDVEPLSPQTPGQLESGEADLALGFIPQLEAGFYQQVLFQQRYVCMASADHPRVRGSLTLRQFEREAHAVVTSLGTGHAIVDREIVRRGIRHRVALHVPSFVGLAFIIEQTDLLVTIPQRLGEILAGRGRFRVFPVPFELPMFSVKQHWHERYHNDPANRWLRSVISELLSETQAHPAPRPARRLKR